MDVLKIIASLKERLMSDYGDVLKRPFTQDEIHDTYYASDLLAQHGMDHNGSYLWDQKAINAAFIAGQRVANKKLETSFKDRERELLESMRAINDISSGWDH